MPSYLLAAITKLGVLLISKKFWGTVIPVALFFFHHTGAWTPTDIQFLCLPILVFVAGEFGLDYARIKTDAPVVGDIETFVEQKVAGMLQNHAAVIAKTITDSIHTASPKVVVELPSGQKLVKPATQLEPGDKLAAAEVQPSDVKKLDDGIALKA